MSTEIYRGRPEDPLLSSINHEDGTRIWHPKFFAIEGPEGKPGACIWIGSSNLKTQIAEKLRATRWNVSINYPDLSFNQEMGVYLGRRFFIGPQKGGTYLKSTEDKRILHNNYYHCGNFWLGIARFPLPPNAHFPDSFWPGWAHLVHLDPRINWQYSHYARNHPRLTDSRGEGFYGFYEGYCANGECKKLVDFTSKLPAPEDIFSFVASIIEEVGYPNLQQLSEIIIRKFQIPLKGVGEKVVYAHFPWLDPVINSNVSGH